MSVTAHALSFKPSALTLGDDVDFDDEEIDAFAESELFDCSDVSWEIKQTRNRCKIYLIAESETPFNLMKMYLALKEYTFRIETEIGIMAEDIEEH